MRIDRIKLITTLAIKDMSLKRLCELSQLSRATITAVKSGKSCTEETARKIAAGLGVPVTEILAKEA